MPKRQKGGRSARKPYDKPDDEVTDKEMAVKEPTRVTNHTKSELDLFSEPTISTANKKCSWTQFAQSQQGMNPLKIKIEQSSHFIKLKDISIEFDVQFMGANNARLVQTDMTAPVNNIGHSLIQQIILTINGSNVEQSSSTYYYYKAFLSRLLEYGIEEKNTNLSIEGFYPDDAGKIDETNMTPHLAGAYQFGGANGRIGTAGSPTAAELNRVLGHLVKGIYDKQSVILPVNVGAMKRHKLCCSNRNVHFEIHPEIPLLKSERYLPPGCELEFTIYWARPEVVFQADQGQANAHAQTPKFTIVDGSPKVNIKNAMIDEQLHIQLESQMLKDQMIAKYPLMSQPFKTAVIPDGRREYEWYNVFSGKVPNYMILTLQRADALQGSFTHSFTNLQRHNLSTIRVTRGGEEIPLPRISFQKHYKEEGFKAMLEFTGRGIESPPLGVSRETYPDGYFMLLYNFNPDGEQNFDHDYDKNNGIVNIYVSFSNDTANNTTLCALGYIENQLWIDGNKNVTLKNGTAE
ncbi:uncharacterized protein F54H12.2 [Exaiptasia diaphana]|uniref:Uncharacterized protein n=1 Tax=Exaiptasia diaphana TaxID=2652724 RepID=A0A913XXL5_EXADI|nr:uncharacterized protein F54H12.2 [Exaiptasia diaphana]